ncbi:helix-turn-helix domain-containing protein [Morganella morganii]|uniref:helix-turn-helix domain-containing protein n=1 Tax=Morganella morganii TaxID=582 RepID=UPI0006841E09|nr:helix-turn-helix transcriptional regulator [Morganella morganii]
MPVNNKQNSAAINQAAGAVIRSLRKEKNLSGYDLGCLTGLSQQQISRYERGNNHLTLTLLIEILFALDVSLDEFLYQINIYCGFTDSKNMLSVFRKELSVIIL